MYKTRSQFFTPQLFSTRRPSSSFYTAIFSLCFAATLSFSVQAEQVTAAIAANFAGTMKQLKPLFKQQSGHSLVTSFASSGTLFAQIHNGAPFDVFLSADKQRPRQLIKEGLAIADSSFIYATGKLVLWSSQPTLIDPEGNVLRTGHWQQQGIRHIAIANPKTAPYGRAAMQTLQTLQLLDVTKPYRVTGQNIAQTFQFIASGNAQLGFIAHTQLLALPKNERGSYWPVPKEMHSPIQQMAVMLNRGHDNSAAGDFLKFLKSPQAKAIIRAEGYY
ncbi:MAG: molybdate ABC transporter substrate-binding protein [Cellvibrionales bacterium]|nr:MAG: molybdate ABC transporter substrate-binding protein [Cellvibrionales bacterium]